MLNALAALLVFQLAGETASQLLKLAVPGPVIGLALLLAAMSLRPSFGGALRDTAAGLLQHLSLLFVPAGVGVMLHAKRIAGEWVAIVAALVLGTMVAIAVTGLVIKLCARWLHGGGQA